MRQLFIFICLFTCGIAYSQNVVKYLGTIGDRYNIQMELGSANGKDFTGRYRYEGKKEWIDLKGAMYEGKKGAEQNLVLQEFVGDKQTGTFELVTDGDALKGTWRKDLGSPLLQVKLVVNEGVSSDLDGFYYVENNEMKIRVTSDTEMEATIWIAANRNCTGVKLKGKLIKIGQEWKGSLDDEHESGSAAVALSFVGDKVNIQINPAFLPGVGCMMNATPYVRQMRKEQGELK